MTQTRYFYFMEKQLTTQQYADLMGVCAGAIRKAISIGQPFPLGVRRAKFGKAHLFYVPESFIKQQKKRLKKVA